MLSPSGDTPNTRCKWFTCTSDVPFPTLLIAAAAKAKCNFGVRRRRIIANMESILSDLQANSEHLYKEKKFRAVEEMFSTFLKEAKDEAKDVRAKALNNRGHAK